MRHDPALPRRPGLSVLILTATVVGALVGALALTGQQQAVADPPPAPPAPPVAEPPTPDVAGSAGHVASPIVAAGSLRVGDDWTDATFGADLTDPVVVVGPSGRQDPDPVTTRLGRITGGGFAARLVEWPGTDAPAHDREVITWLAVDRGVHRLASGAVVEAGSVIAEPGSPHTVSIDLDNRHDESPIVLATPLTVHGPAISPVVTAVSPDRVLVHVVPPPGEVLDEPVRIEYVAWSPGKGTAEDGQPWTATTIGLRGGELAARVPERLAPRAERCTLASPLGEPTPRSLRWVVAGDGAVGLWSQPAPGTPDPTQPGRASMLALPCGSAPLAAVGGAPAPAPPPPPPTGATTLVLTPPAVPALAGDPGATVAGIAEGRQPTALAAAHDLGMRTGALAAPGAEAVVGALAAAGTVDVAAIGSNLVTRWAGAMQTDPLVVSVVVVRDTPALERTTAELAAVIRDDPRLAARTHLLSLDLSGDGPVTLHQTGPAPGSDGGRASGSVAVRDAAVANHVLRLVGLPPVPGSTVNVAQDGVLP